jgi:hypothetical protein
MQFPQEMPLYKDMFDLRNLYDKMNDMSLKRLKHEDRDKDKRLSEPGDAYF